LLTIEAIVSNLKHTNHYSGIVIWSIAVFHHWDARNEESLNQSDSLPKHMGVATHCGLHKDIDEHVVPSVVVRNGSTSWAIHPKLDELFRVLCISVVTLKEDLKTTLVVVEVFTRGCPYPSGQVGVNH
jgi:hypothetical protein